MARFIDARSFGIAIVIFLFSSVVGLIYNSVYPKGIPLIRKRVKVGDTLLITPTEQRPDTQPVSRALGREETFAAYESGGAVFLDARPRSDYEEGHIEGALSLPEFHFDDVYPQLSELLTPQTHIIVYCQGRDCDESIIVAERLVEMGHRRVDVFLGGWPEWEDAGYPAEKGPSERGAE